METAGTDSDHCVPFVADCRVRLATDLVTNTWDPVLLSALRAGPLRRGELLGGIGGISDKVFSQSLARLVASGMVSRLGADDGRVVLLVLTDLGRSFAEGPLLAMATWAAEYGDDLQDAQDVRRG